MTYRIRFILSLIWISMALGGCSTYHGNVTPRHTPTMADIYQSIEHSSESLTQARASLTNDLPPSGPVTYVNAHTTPTRFATLPNPLITLYVYPHLATQDQLPIPGYHTQFPLYPTISFAKPSDEPLPSWEVGV